MSSSQKCSFVKPDGTACRAAATASGHCFFHSGKAAEAGSKGGRRSRKRPVILPADAEDMPLAVPADITNALAKIFNEVRKGRIDPKVGNCLGLLAGQLRRAMETSEIAERLDEIEKRQDAADQEMEKRDYERRLCVKTNPPPPSSDQGAVEPSRRPPVAEMANFFRKQNKA